MPPPSSALRNPTVTPSGANVIIGFDTDAAADSILLTSREQVPFVAGTPVSVGGGRSQVTVSLSTLNLTAGNDQVRVEQVSSVATGVVVNVSVGGLTQQFGAGVVV